MNTLKGSKKQENRFQGTFGSESDLSLDYIKNNSNITKISRDFACSNIYMRGLDDEKKIIKTVKLPCNKWTCEFCRRRKIKKLRKQAITGINNYFETKVKKKGFRESYCLKLLTLTVPGKDYRSKDSSLIYREAYKGKTTIEQANKEIKSNFNKLRTVLSKQFGDMKYFLTVEPQRDGYPHLHIILVGRSIAGKQILKVVRDLWVHKYKMGSQMDIKPIKYGVKGGVNYATKYLTKLPKGLPKGMRFYTASRKLLHVERYESNFTYYEWGFLERDNSTGDVMLRPMHVAPDCRDPNYDVDLSRNLKELCDFFDDCKKETYGMRKQDSLF